MEQQSVPVDPEAVRIDCEQKFRRQFDEVSAARHIHRPCVLVCGGTGVGKTSLIQAVCGDVVPPDRIGAGVPLTQDYDLYENPYIRIWDSKGLELGEAASGFIDRTRLFLRERQALPDVDDHIHLVWYAVSGPGARVTDCDLELMRSIFNPRDVVAVVTKLDITGGNQFSAIRRRLMESGVPPDRILGCSDEESGSRGCTELIRLSCELLPEAYRDAFAEAQKLDQSLKIERILARKRKARLIIATGASLAAAVGVTPIPVADSAMLAPLQVTMIASLAVLYDLKDATVKEAALPFIARVTGVFTASSLLKIMPFLGSTVNAGVAAALTGAMGFYVQSAFEKMAVARVRGEPMPDMPFDPDLFRRYYEQYLCRPPVRP